MFTHTLPSRLCLIAPLLEAGLPTDQVCSPLTSNKVLQPPTKIVGPGFQKSLAVRAMKGSVAPVPLGLLFHDFEQFAEMKHVTLDVEAFAVQRLQGVIPYLKDVLCLVASGDQPAFVSV